MKKILIVYSTLTGNTKLVAENVFESVSGDKEIISIGDIKKVDIDSYDYIVVGYWVDKGTTDPRTKKFLKSISGKNLILFGTLGAHPESDHAKKVHIRVAKLCRKNNFLGNFLCRGKVDPKIMEKLASFPLRLLHKISIEELNKMEEEAKSHPDKDDLKNVTEFVLSCLK